MSKFIRTAAQVVGAVVAIAAAIPTGGASVAAGATLLSAELGVSAATAGLIALGTEVAAFGISALTAPKPKAPPGNPMQWQSDPQAGIPIVIGRAYSGGKIIYRQGWGKNNKWETLHTVYSVGPIQSFEQFYVDGVATTVSADTTVNIADRGYMFERHQLGAQPEAAALQVGQGGYPPGIGVTSRISGLAASAIQLVYDTKGKTTLATEPQCGYVLQGVRVYDPRKDSTYPGGSGSQRWNDESTWSYTGKDNPYLAALAWAIGWRQNGKLVAGVGAPISLILLDQFVEGANVADANSWKCGGVLDTTDDKWQRLKDLLRAGGGEPLRIGAQLGCLINTPRVSLATIGVNDVIGDASVQVTQAMRDRINAVVPRYMAESSVTTANGDGTYKTTVTWGLAAAGPIVVSDYVTFDGKQRQTQIDFEFVQGPGGGANAPNQVAQLARYAIENAREFGPITLPLKLRFMGYKPGDVVTVTLPELGLNGQDILLLNRSLDPGKGAVTMTARSETYAKHAFALGQTTTAPATPSVSGPPLIPTPDPADWAITATSYTANGQTLPALVVTGDPDIVADAVIFEFRQYTGTQGVDDDWQTAGITSLHVGDMPITGLIGGIQYQVSIRYRWGPGAGARLIRCPATPALPGGLGGPGSWTILNRENMSIVGSTVSKTGGANNWGDASVVSAESYVGGASCSFQPAQANAAFMIGLNSDPGTDDGYTSLDFAWQVGENGKCYPYEGGTNVGGNWPYAAGDTFQVVYNGATVSYVQNGTVRYSHAVGPNLQLWLDSAFATPGGKATNLTFAGTGAKGTDGVNGTQGVPGPGTFTLVNRANMTVAGSTATKTGGGAAWNGSVVSAESFTGGAICSFQAGQANADLFVGLNSDPSTDDNYTSIDFAWQLQANGQCWVEEAGSAVAGPFTYATGDTFQIVYNNATVTYLQNGVVRGSHTATSGKQLWLDSSFNTVGGKVTNITFGPNGQTLYTWIAYADSADGSVNFTTGAPGGRAYQGIAVNQTTPTEGTNPATYQWGLYRGPASFGLVATGNCVVGPDYIIKNGGASAWDSSAYSTESWQGGCQLSWTAADASHQVMMGLNTDPATDGSYTSIDYAMYLPSGGTAVGVYNNGTLVFAFAPYVAGDRFQIRYDGKLVTYYKNGVAFYSQAAAAGLSLFFDSSIADPGGRVNNIAFGPAGGAGSDGSGTVTMIPVGAVTKSPDGLDCPVASGNWTTNGAYSAQVFSGGVNLSFKRPNSYGTEDAFLGLNSDPSSNINYSNIDYALRHCWDTGSSSFIVQIWESGTAIQTFGWDGSFTYQIRYDGQNVIYSQYNPSNGTTNILRTVAAGAGRSFGVNMTAQGKASITNMSFTAAGAAGVNAVVVTPQPAALQIQASASGAPISGALPAAIGNTATQAGNAIGITSVSIVATNGCTASVSGTDVRITAISGASGDVTYDVVAGGQTTRLNIPFSVNMAGAAGNVAQQIIATSPQVTWTSYNQHGNTIGINSSATGKLLVSCQGRYNCASDGTTMIIQGKIQYRVAGGTWVDVPGSEQTGTTAQHVSDPDRDIASQVFCGPVTLTGLTASAAYEVRFLNRISGGTATTSTTARTTLYAEQVS